MKAVTERQEGTGSIRESIAELTLPAKLNGEAVIARGRSTSAPAIATLGRERLVRSVYSPMALSSDSAEINLCRPSHYLPQLSLTRIHLSLHSGILIVYEASP